MTRFLLSLDRAVDIIFEALAHGNPGETFVPKVPSSRIVDIAAAMIGSQEIETVVTGIRPGEKIHEILVSEEEAHRTVDAGDYYVILPILPELRSYRQEIEPIGHEYSSADNLASPQAICELLREHDLVCSVAEPLGRELLR